MYGLAPEAPYPGTWSRRYELKPASCRQTSSLLSETKSTEPTVNAYQLPAKSGVPLPGSWNLVRYDVNPCGPFPLSFSWLPSAGIHGRKLADLVMFAK